MYVFVQTVDTKRKEKIIVSKNSTIGNLKKIVSRAFDIDTEEQRLFFRGKQLVDSYLLVDYNINLNDVIQLFIKGNLVESVEKKPLIENDSSLRPDETLLKPDSDERSVLQSKYYKVNDIVDVNQVGGNWVHGRIKGIFEKTSPKVNKSEEDNESHKFVVEILDSNQLEKYPPNCIRPYAREAIEFDSLKEGDMVLANYCVENPNLLGYWYSCVIKKIKKARRPSLKVDIILGSENVLTTGCNIGYVDYIYKIQNPKPVSERTEEEDELLQSLIPERNPGPTCGHCKDVENMKCKYCGCQICYEKNEPEKLVLCDECDLGFHIWCLDPPLDEIPKDEYWYCKNCKNDENEIVRAGEGLKGKKRISSAKENKKSGKDWGKGMACVGRTSICTIVGLNHFGPIPGIEVGASWRFRFQVSEAGVHRPHVAGIHGRESDGAYSIALSGGYEDDVDNGDEFTYTGSGGRDLSGNKRTAEQSSDQTLTRMNKALALNCNAPFNNIVGATALDWKNGKPVRVVRNFKLGKSSKYAPIEGNRYDGIYKVVRYYPVKGKSGFIVWHYLLRRDDPSPAPWTKKGKDLISSLGLEMIYPEGYEDNNNKPISEKDMRKKRLHEGADIPEKSPPAKKLKKIAPFTLSEDVEKHIMKDGLNAKLWILVKDHLKLGKQKFLKEVENCFMCICCQDLVSDPVTTPCNHNFCKDCLERSIIAQVYTCPSCRYLLGNKYTIAMNEHLKNALLILFPGYNTGC